MKRTWLVALVMSALLVGVASYARAPQSDAGIILKTEFGEVQGAVVLVPPGSAVTPQALTQWWTSNTNTPPLPSITDFHGGDILANVTGTLQVPRGADDDFVMDISYFVDFQGTEYHIQRWDATAYVPVYVPPDYPYEYVDAYFFAWWTLSPNLQNMRSSHPFRWHADCSSPWGSGSGGSAFTIHPGS